MVSEATKTDEKISAKPQNNKDGDNCVVEDVNDDEDYDEISVASSSDSQIECDKGGAMVLSDAQDRNPCFQNIEVTNSSDVHFGNKTYYQGPVTIKQILYTNPSQNDDNDGEQNGEHKLSITDVDCDGKINNGYVTSETVNGAVKNSNCNNNSNSISNNWTQKSKGKKWLQKRTSKQLILGTAILILVMVSAIVLTLTLLMRYSPSTNHKNTNVGETEPSDGGPNNDPEAVVNMITRRGWLAERPTKTAPLDYPVSKVIFVETLTNNCHSEAECIYLVRHTQTKHKEGQSQWDIRYNFVVGGDGNVYDARGWDTLSSTIPNCNHNSLGIAFTGTFTHLAPPEKQVNAAKRLLKMGVNKGYIKPDYKFVYGSQLLGENNDSSEKLEEILKTWPHWSSTNYFDNDTLKSEFCNS